MAQSIQLVTWKLALHTTGGPDASVQTHPETLTITVLDPLQTRQAPLLPAPRKASSCCANAHTRPQDYTEGRQLVRGQA